VYNSNIESGGESMDVTEIGFKIKSYRERNNLKQSEIAEKLGLTISALSKIESGKQKVDASTLITFIRFSKEYEMFFEMDNNSNYNFTNTNQIVTGNNRTLFERLANFCKEYPFIVNEKFSGHEIGRYIRHQLPIELLEYAEFNTDVYKAYGSVGIGTWAKIPWIAFLDKSITNTVQKGIYINHHHSYAE
jgi:transcriptional regulator with XRE-family HTH domain